MTRFTPLLLIVALGCSPEPPAGPACDDPALGDLRRDFLDRLALPGPPGPSGGVLLGEPQVGDGFSLRFVRWDHPHVAGDAVHGLWLQPDPLPPGPLPLAVNLHGHWDQGVLADETLRRAELLARQGWAVLSVAMRGAEDTELSAPTWRATHYAAGLRSELRLRAAGSTPLAWDVAAAQAGLGAALDGAFGVAVDRRRVVALGASAGAERALALAIVDPRVGPVVAAAYEYAWDGQDGQAGCSCGVLPGAREPVAWPGHEGAVERRRAWLALATCRPGAPPRQRSVLLLDHLPSDDVEALAVSRGARREAVGAHAFTPDMAGRAWAFVVGALEGEEPPADAIDRAVSGVGSAYRQPDPAGRLPYRDGAPGPGQAE